MASEYAFMFHSPRRYSRLSLFCVIALTPVLVAMLATRTSALITYYDAVWGAGGNTTFLDGSVFAPEPSSATAGDDKWRERPNFGHGNTILESNGNANNTTTNPENAPMLRTTITGLTPNTEYNVYGYFWSNVQTTGTPQDWKLKATFNSGLINNNGTPANVLDDFLPATLATAYSESGSATPPVSNNTPAIATGFDGTNNLGIGTDATGFSTGHFVSPTRIRSTDNTLAMFQASLGVTTSNASGEISVYVDDMEEQSSLFRTWYDGVGYDLPGQPTLTINRQTGEMVFNTGVSRDIIGYSIRSDSGALNQANWLKVTGRLDAPPSGNGTIDPNDTWRVLSDPALSTYLSEAELGETGPLDGAVLAPGTTINFGNSWRKYFLEDIRMDLLRNDGQGTVEPVNIVYSGTASSYVRGDLNFNGTIGPEDYAIFIANLFGNVPNSVAGAYALGDVTGDLAINYNDLVEFRDIYDIANGAGAFAAMVASVPEPTSLALVAGLGVVLLAVNRKRGSEAVTESQFAKSTSIVAGVALALTVCVSAAVAQTTYVDATETPGGNTTRLDGTDFTSPGDVNQNDGLWRKRAFGNNDTIFEANAAAGTGENAHMLRTTITGLVPNAQYNIYGYFWSNPVENWRLKATVQTSNINDNGTPGDTSDDFIANVPAVAFSANGSPTSTTAPLAKANHFSSTTLIRDLDTNPNILLYEAPLGAIAADAGGTVRVYIDDLENQTSATLRTFYDGVGFERVTPLTLMVNTTNGATRIVNKAGTPVTFDYYQITSAMNSLNPAGWQSLDVQNYDAVDGADVGNIAGDSLLEGWDAAGGSDEGMLGEVKFLASSTLADQAFRSIGNAFQVGDQQDLVFSFERGGRLQTGPVEYVTSFPGVLVGDYDHSGVVDIGDYNTWRSTFGSTTVLDADGNGDSVVNAADYIVWKNVIAGGSGSALGSAAGVPEPGTAAILAILALCGVCSARTRQSSLSRRFGVVCSVALAAIVAQRAEVALATTFPDRLYSFGEDSLEGPSQNGVIGGNNTSPLTAGNTADSVGPTNAYLDLTQFGNPVYANVGSGGLNRPGAGVNTYGAKFDGVDDYLTGIALNRPDEILNFAPTFPLNYTGISARGAQMWVYPNAATIGTRRQTILMDTIDAGGVAITASGKWTAINDGHFDDDDITPTVNVVGNQWYHVMQHVHTSNTPGAPKVASASADLGFTAVVYVNGIAVAANNDSRIVNESIAGSRTGALFVGAEELPDPDGTSPSAIVGNYFDGVVDDLKMYVYGDNTAQGGQNYGTFNLFTDNDWIANRIATTVPGGILKNGDLNRDGNVTSADVNAFVAGWLDRKLLVGAHNTISVGDWETWASGDLDHDGVVYLKDAFLMQQAMKLAGLGALVLDGSGVPEPSAIMLVAAAGGVWLSRSRRRS
jgi:hypothetical protein